MSNWDRIIKPVVVLCSICIVIAGALAVTNSQTAPIIAGATLAAQETARKELLPEADSFTRVDSVSVPNVSDVYVADNGVGTVITCSAPGYGGPITVMVAFEPDGSIRRIEITQQTETAGLGSKIQTDENFLGSFVDRPAKPFTVTDINAISGATISSKAVAEAVNAAIDAYLSIS